MNRLQRHTLVFAACVATVAVISAAFDSGPRASSSRKIQRAIDQSRIEEIKRHDLNVNNLHGSYINELPSSHNFDNSVVDEQHPVINQGSTSLAATPPPPSPGIPIAKSSYDYQHNTSAGYQVARMPGANTVHFIWMSWDRIPTSVDDNDRYVAYSSYNVSTGTLNQPFGGVFVGLGVLARAGYSNGDVFDDNTFQATLHQRSDPSLPYNPWRLNFTTPGSSTHVSEGLEGFGAGGCAEVLWPRIATSRDGDRTVHIVAHSNTYDCLVDLLWYWRHDGTTWTGPVIIDSTPQASHVLADDPTGDKLAVAVHVSNHVSMNGINNVAYLESLTDGAGWIAGTEPKIKNVLTSYNTDAGPGAWLHLSTAYDHAGVLHIVWDEQEDANDNSKTAIRHWNSQRQTIRTVALGYYDTPFLTGAFNLNLAKITLGIGDGGTPCQGGAESNEDYLYVLYTQFGGPSPDEEADRSLEGRYNGELYLAVSNTNGKTWSVPVNLTNTKTPNCNPGGTDSITFEPDKPDSVCRSEHWATIGMAVSDIDIFFISDIDAGGVPHGEGTWQMNPVHYLRIPGGTTDAQHLCPVITSNFEASLTSIPECERHTGQNGTLFETLTLLNLGNGQLDGSISVTDFPGAATLSVSGTGTYSIIAGDPDDIRTVTMSANGAPEGLYHGMISITHDDPNEPNPREYPIDLFIFNEFYCPQFAGLKTGVASPGSLMMQVSNDGRFGNGMPEMGIWRHKDSSSSLNAGTLLIAHGTQSADTTVFLRYGTRSSNGQAGFRALSDLVIDTSAYSTGEGCATATTQLVTADSIVGITLQWEFPQSPSLDEIILAHVKIYRHDPLIPVTNLAVGILADLNVLPAPRHGQIQRGSTNRPWMDYNRNLIWANGVDTVGHVVMGQKTAARFRAGVVFQPGWEGLLFGNAEVDIQPGGGPTDGFLYSSLQNLAGIDLYSVSDTDLYAIASLDRGRSIAAGETLAYTFALISDTLSEASLLATADLVIAHPNSICTGCYCPCKYDPICDGLVSNAQDVVKVVDVAFRGVSAPIDPECLFERTDVDASGETSVTDVVKVVNVAFRGQTVAANYVDPCAP